MTSWTTIPDDSACDLLIVGAGIVGLAHAVAAMATGARVTVIERDARAVGASVRNFGHGCFTAQAGLPLDYAMKTRPEWLRLAKAAGFWIRTAGTVVVARADDEYAVLEDFQRDRGEDVVLLDAAGVGKRVPVTADVVGGAWLPLDVRVDPRQVPAALADWLAGQGVRFHFSTSLQRVDGEDVLTSRGVLRAKKVVIAVGHDVDQHYPDIAEQAQVQRCMLQMLQLAGATTAQVEPAVLTGWSLLRYEGFADSAALPALRGRLSAQDPVSVDAGLHLMFTQRPDGDIVLGDTHSYSQLVDPFQNPGLEDLLLAHAHRLFGGHPISVRHRWQGIYASAPDPFLVAAPTPDLRIVSVTSGIGMTTGFGLGQEVIAELL